MAGAFSTGWKPHPYQMLPPARPESLNTADGRMEPGLGYPDIDAAQTAATAFAPLPLPPGLAVLLKKYGGL